ncbi:MAG: PD-(D/E)XK nuclease family protein [Firmicutes bacterium]|nr:PD-(D/E)XK nuclease family protein [Bacillota bacterium]
MQHLSFSRLSLLDTCGLRFYFEYVQELPPEDPVPMYHARFGTLLHSLYESHALSQGGESYEELKMRYDQAYPELVGLFPSREEAVTFYKNGLRAIARFSRYVVSDVVASEREFIVEIAPGVPPVKGFIDRLLHTDDHGYMVADLKTGKVFNGRDRRKFRQLAIYSLACENLYGKPAASGYFDFVVHGERAWVDISEQDRGEARAWVTQKWEQIDREDFQPHYSPGFCRTYCPFRSRCPEFAAREAQRQSAPTRA